MHARRQWDPALDELIARVAADPPDFIVYTGDFVDNKQKTRQSMPLVRRLVNSLKSRLGAAAILGNHDGDLLGPPLASLNLTLLDHRRRIAPLQAVCKAPSRGVFFSNAVFSAARPLRLGRDFVCWRRQTG